MNFFKKIGREIQKDPNIGMAKKMLGGQRGQKGQGDYTESPTNPDLQNQARSDAAGAGTIGYYGVKR